MIGDRDRRRVLVVVGCFEPGYRAGGPIRSVAHIVDNAPDDVDITVVTSDRDLGMTTPYPGLSGTWFQRGRHRVFYLDVRRPGQWAALLRSLRETPFETLYVNSFWSPVFALLPVVASRLRIFRSERVLVAPRGELSAGALTIKNAKKRLALPIWRPWFGRPDVIWHATSDGEVEDVLRAFPAADVRHVSNEASRPEEAFEPPPAQPGPLRLVFLSRISPKKNLHGLLAALADVRGQVSLDVYGPVGEPDYWGRCQRIMSTLPEHVTVTYRGAVTHEEVPSTFARYDAFCLPTLGENFGHVMAESLASSCPVICTDLTPWTDVLRHGGGAVLDGTGSGDIAAELQRWIDLTPEQRHARRIDAGRAYERWNAGRDVEGVLERTRPATARRAGGPCRVALVTQGFATGGGVPQVARWMRDSLSAMDDFTVDIHDVATSRQDPYSRRLVAPSTWRRRSLRHDSAPGETSWGANGVELEFMRYRPRRELTRTLDGYDLVQVVCGGPALGRVTERVSVPVVLETATRTAWERESQLRRTPRHLRLWRTAMTRLTERTERRALAGADAVIVPNQRLAEDVRRHTVAPVHVIPHGIDTQRFHPRPGGRDAHGYLLTVCRLGDPRKGLDRLVEAYGLLVRRNPGSPQLVLAGKGELSPAVQEAIERLALTERIAVRSDVPVEQLPQLYRDASVFVQASLEEGFGIAVVEAMASALPVVCTDTAGTRETVLDGRTGWVVPQDPDAVIGRMADALACALGPEGARRGLDGLARCQDLFSRDVTIKQVTRVYDRLIGRGGRDVTSA